MEMVSRYHSVFDRCLMFPDAIQATDAALIAEIDSTYLSATNKDVLSESVQFEEKLIISTANADYLPNVNVGNQTVVICKDGRWGGEDWAQWPQWYFDGHGHFPFVLRKPSPADLPTHPLRILWWNMDEIHFVKEAGLDVGFLAKSISDQLYAIRSKLMTEVVACACQDGRDYQKLHESARKMRACTSALRYTPPQIYRCQTPRHFRAAILLANSRYLRQDYKMG